MMMETYGNHFGTLADDNSDKNSTIRGDKIIDVDARIVTWHQNMLEQM